MKSENCQPTPETKEQKQAKESLDFLLRERNDCIDDLPGERVTPEDPNYKKYKCRTNWWHGIIGRFTYLLKYTALIDDPRVADEMERFLDYAGTLNFDKFRKREEIERANDSIDIVTAHLEKKAGGA